MMTPEEILTEARRLARRQARKQGLELDDVVQDVALRVLSFEDIRPEAIYVTVQRVLAEKVRSRQKGYEVVALPGTLEAVAEPAPDHAPSVSLRVDVRTALQRLPVHEREVVWLVGAVGHTLDSAAEELLIHPSSAHRRWESGAYKMRLLLADYAPEGWAEQELVQTD